MVRAGVEYRVEPGADSRLRIELAYVREFWSLHDSIDVRSENVRLYNVSGFPSPFGVAPISLPRRFQDSNSFRLGGELSLKDLIKDYWIDLRAGVSYETSASRCFSTSWIIGTPCSASCRRAFRPEALRRKASGLKALLQGAQDLRLTSAQRVLLMP